MTPMMKLILSRRKRLFLSVALLFFLVYISQYPLVDMRVEQVDGALAKCSSPKKGREKLNFITSAGVSVQTLHRLYDCGQLVSKIRQGRLEIEYTLPDRTVYSVVHNGKVVSSVSPLLIPFCAWFLATFLIFIPDRRNKNRKNQEGVAE